MSEITLTEDQQNASHTFIDFLVDDTQKYMVIQGAAGSGKSFLLKHLLNTFQAKYKTYNILLQRDPSHEFKINLTATTNKAVAVVREFTGDLDSKTIHSLLGLRVMNDFKTGKTKLQKTKDYKILRNRLIIIDEASFIDNALFSVLDESTKDCKILLVGDQYQLAPVGQQDSVMETLDCTKVMMNKIMRNSGTIMTTGAQFRDTVESGIFRPITYYNDKLIHVDGSTFKDMVKDIYLDSIIEHNSNHVKILAWTNAKVQAYNAHVREVKHLPPLLDIGEYVVTNKPIILSGTMIPVDSTVLITEIDDNGYKIHNVPGRYVTINHNRALFLPNDFNQVKKLLKQLANDKNWSTYFEIKDSWLDLRSIYASSIHKAQGSTYHTVFIDLTDIGVNWIASDVARLLYVAISRASHKVICYGQLPAKYMGE